MVIYCVDNLESWMVHLSIAWFDLIFNNSTNGVRRKVPVVIYQNNNYYYTAIDWALLIKIKALYKTRFFNCNRNVNSERSDEQNWYQLNFEPFEDLKQDVRTIQIKCSIQERNDMTKKAHLIGLFQISFDYMYIGMVQLLIMITW